MKIAKTTFELTRSFPKSEFYGLTSQINRSAVSIPSNIAEGAGRAGNKEFVQFFNIAMGSCFELETQMRLAKEFRYLEEKTLNNFLINITKLEKMMNALISSLKK